MSVVVDSDARPGYPEQVPAGPVVAMLDTLPDRVCSTDLQGRIRVINRLAEMFGYDRAELLGRDVELLMPQRVRDQHQRWRTGSSVGPMSRHLGSGLPLIGRRRDGSEFPVDIALARVNGEQSELSVAIVRDVSDQRRADAERDRLRAAARQAAHLQRATAVLTNARGVG